MILVKLLDERYSTMEFEFESMEEASIFVEMVKKASEKLLRIEITISIKEAV
jgi:hypothetical protein